VGASCPELVSLSLEAYADVWPTCLGMYELARLVAGLGLHCVYPRAFMDQVTCRAPAGPLLGPCWVRMACNARVPLGPCINQAT